MRDRLEAPLLERRLDTRAVGLRCAAAETLNENFFHCSVIVSRDGRLKGNKGVPVEAEFISGRVPTLRIDERPGCPQETLLDNRE